MDATTAPTLNTPGRTVKLRWSAKSTEAETQYTDTQKKEIAALYADHEDVIRASVAAFARKYGGHFDDLFADANHYFLMAYDYYDSSKPFATWLRYWVWYEMFDDYRTKLRRQVRAPMAGGDALELAPGYTDTQWSEEDFASELNPDAALVLRLTLHSKEVDAEAEERGGSPRNVRSVLRAYLADIGWAADRIAEAFDDIRTALNG